MSRRSASGDADGNLWPVTIPLGVAYRLEGGSSLLWAASGGYQSGQTDVAVELS
jgi:hypothetical protein